MIESERVLEKYLVSEVKKLGGWAVKLLSGLVTGLPDRLILLPDGLVAFVEVKTTGKKASVRQLWVHERLKVLGFRVEVLDSKEGINNFINNYKPTAKDPFFCELCKTHIGCSYYNFSVECEEEIKYRKNDK